MKPMNLLTVLTGGMFLTAAVLAQDAPAGNSPAVTNVVTITNVVTVTNIAPAAAPDQAPSDQTPQPPAADSTTSPSVPPPVAPAAAAPIPANTPMPAVQTNRWTVKMSGANSTKKGLIMNFRGVPLETVLNYMSDAAGFIIHPKVDVHGKVDVWSAQPLSPDEAVKLLKQILNENGYTAIQDGRILTIVPTDQAKNNDIPVSMGEDPNSIPRNSDIVTQIIPVHSLNVVELVKTLQPLLPSSATIASDESANALVLTDTQADIHRMVEIISALDSVTTSGATIKVFKLKFADSKSLASLIKDLFTTDTSASTRNGQAGGGFGFGRFRGFPGFGGGGGPSGGANDDQNGHTPTAKVNAVSDDNSNTLIVTAPDSLINGIADLVNSIDTQIADTTEVRIFYLKNADPTEMVDLLTTLFPSDATAENSSAQQRASFRFGFGFPGAQPAAGANKSDREKQLSQVTAVADRRTASLVVTAGKDLMPEIANLILSLDSRNDRKQQVFVIPLANAEPIDVVQVLQDIFPSSSGTSGSSSSSLSSTTSNPLLNRSQTLLQQQNTSANSSFGSGSGGGGTGSRGF